MIPDKWAEHVERCLNTKVTQALLKYCSLIFTDCCDSWFISVAFNLKLN